MVRRTTGATAKTREGAVDEIEGTEKEDDGDGGSVFVVGIATGVADAAMETEAETVRGMATEGTLTDLQGRLREEEVGDTSVC